MTPADELLSYYHAELGYLRRAGAEFAAKHPKAAARLELGPEECPDPHVERLIESVAFLTGRIRRELDRDLPEVAAALLEVLYPHLVRPVPSMTVARFEADPKQGKLTRGHVVARHTPLFAAAAEAVADPLPGGERDRGGAERLRCRFRTAYPVTLWPVEVTQVALESPDRYDWLDDGRVAAVLRVEVRAAGVALDELEGFDRLRFYLGNDFRTGAVLYERLFSALHDVVLVPEGSGAPVHLGPDAVEAVGFGEDEDVIPWPPHAHPAYRLLQEHFATPRKFLFVDVRGVERHASKGRFDLVFALTRTLPERVPVDRASFQLGCAPVVNLFRRPGEPVRVDHRTHEYRLVADFRREKSTEIHSVLRVSSTSDPREDTRVLEPFFSFSHEAAGRGARAFWHARRVPCERADLSGTDVLLSFVDLDFHPARPPTDVVYAQLLCTNRGLAESLPAGAELQVEVPAPLRQVIALHAPTPQLDPPVGSAALWRLVSHLSLNHLSLGGPDGVRALKEILRLYAPFGRASAHQEIGGVREMACRPVAQRVGEGGWRGFCRGTEIELTLDEDAFPAGGAFLLAAVLDRFFALYATLNSFTRTVLRSRQREETWMRWPYRAGRKPLL